MSLPQSAMQILSQPVQYEHKQDKFLVYIYSALYYFFSFFLSF